MSSLQSRGQIVFDGLTEDAFEVLEAPTFGSFTVADPTVGHPQDARAGRWEIDRMLLKEGLINGEIELGEVEVV